MILEFEGAGEVKCCAKDNPGSGYVLLVALFGPCGLLCIPCLDSCCDVSDAFWARLPCAKVEKVSLLVHPGPDHGLLAFMLLW